MRFKRILIIGGYGSAGSVTSDLLMELTDCNLLIGGRNLEKATEHSKKLNQKHKSDRCSPVFLDLSRPISFENIDIVINAAPVIKYFKNIVESVEKYKCKCVDITPSTNKNEKCLPDVTENLYITDVGGMFPLTMIKYINLKNMLVANVYNSYEVDWSTINHCKETVPEFNDNTIANSKKNSIYIKNSWYTSEDKPVVLEEIDGEQLEFKTMWSSETELVIKLYPSVIETGCFHRINDGPIKNIDERSILKARIENLYEKKIMYVRCKSGYFLTGAGTVATILQCIKDDNSKGVYTAGEYLNPYTFFNDLEKKMNIEISITDE